MDKCNCPCHTKDDMNCDECCNGVVDIEKLDALLHAIATMWCCDGTHDDVQEMALQLRGGDNETFRS